MSVLSCSRYNCSNIMCDNLIPKIGYICNSCLDEFKIYVKNKKLLDLNSLKTYPDRYAKDVIILVFGDFMDTNKDSSDKNEETDTVIDNFLTNKSLF